LGFGKTGGFDFFQRYCLAKKVVAYYYVFGCEYPLTGCCCKFSRPLPEMETDRLFALAERKKIFQENRKTGRRARV
jgi:hypothetical protein